MTDLLTPADLIPFATIDDAKAAAMIVDAIAMAAIAAPCMADPDTLTTVQAAAAKAVLRGAVLRWNDAGSGAISTAAMGPFSAMLDTKQPRRQMFFPSEIANLQKICKGGSDGGAFSIDTAPECPIRFHEIFFGGEYGEYGERTVGAIAFDCDDVDDAGFY